VGFWEFGAMKQGDRKKIRRLALCRVLVVGGIASLALVFVVLYMLTGSPKIAWIKVGSVNKSGSGLAMQFWIWTSPDVYVALGEVSADDQGRASVSHSGSVSTNQPTNPGVILWPWKRYGLSFDWDWMGVPFSDITPNQVNDRLEVSEGQGYWLSGTEYMRVIEVEGRVLVLCLKEL
jgi:hypothetical protein